MIAPQAMRINNLVYVPETDQTVPITAINLDIGIIVNRSLRMLSFNEIKPIELNEDWLLKFGFEKRTNYQYASKKFIIESWTHKKTFDLRLRLTEESSVIICEIKYVNQLQNLFFALSGEELTIKEQK